MDIRHVKRVAPIRKGIGLYTYEQSRNTTAFQYFVQVVVGVVFAALGGVLLGHAMITRGERILKHGSVDTDPSIWITGLAGVLIGLFIAHAGAIFWFRRLVTSVGSDQRSHKLKK
jgi:hypothetical protein